MFRSLLLPALALLFTLGFAGCGADDNYPTEVVLVVDSDLEEGDEIDHLQVIVYPEFDTSAANRQVANAILGDGQARLPRTLGMVHTGGRLGPYVVQVTGRLGGTTPYRRYARFTFVENESKRLRVVLYRDCAEEFCDGDFLCDAGGLCDGVYDIPLEDWTGSTSASLSVGPAPLDAGP